MDECTLYPEAIENIKFNSGELYSADGKLIGTVELNEHSGAVAQKGLYMSEKDNLWVFWLSNDDTEVIAIKVDVLKEHSIDTLDKNNNIRNPHEYLDQLQPNEYIRKVFEV